MSVTKQPIPQVTPADVERIVRRDFPADECATVMTILSEYGTEKRDQERTRVQLAALKLANGSVQKLRGWIREAKLDFRDVLGPAEYPAYNKRGHLLRDLPADEETRIVDSDWRQYEEWLKRPG
jgi:hypothetical protein